MQQWLSRALMVGLLVLASGSRVGASAATNAGSGTVEFAGCSGTVVETMDAATYTYVQVDTGKEKIWAAAPQFPVKVGDKVAVPPGMPMQNYHSKTLNRTFETIFFVASITTPGQPAGV